MTECHGAVQRHPGLLFTHHDVQTNQVTELDGAETLCSVAECGAEGYWLEPVQVAGVC